MKCFFIPSSGTSMVLLPSESTSHAHPLYHISVDQHCFHPGSYITTIRRGDSESGTFVGDFEYVPLSHGSSSYLDSLHESDARSIWHDQDGRNEAPCG